MGLLKRKVHFVPGAHDQLASRLCASKNCTSTDKDELEEAEEEKEQSSEQISVNFVEKRAAHTLFLRLNYIYSYLLLIKKHKKNKSLNESIKI